MKKITILIAAIFLQQSIALGQCTVRQFSTQPSNPLNTDFTATTPNVNPLLNQFNWGKNDGNTFDPIALNSSVGWYGRGPLAGAFLMNSPFGPVMPSEYHYLSKLGNFTLLHSIEDSRTILGNPIPSIAKVDTFIYSTEFYSLEDLRNIQFAFTIKHPFVYWDNTGNQCPANAPQMFEDRFSNFSEAERKRRWHGIINGQGCAPFFTEGMDIDILRVKFKIASDLYFIQKDYDNNETNTFEVYSYLLKENKAFHLSAPFDNISYTTNKNEVVKYRSGFTRLFDQHITANSPYVDEIIGNNLYLKAENVEIQGFLTVEPGFNYYVQATRSINVVPNSDIQNEIVLELKNFYNLPNIEEANSNYLSTYCQTKYKANKIFRSSPENNGDSITDNQSNDTASLIKDDRKKDIFYISVNPNPVNHLAHLNIYSELKSGIFNLSIISIEGSLVQQGSFNLTEGNNFEINMEHLPNGLYTLLIKYGNEIKHQKIQVLH